MAELVPVVPALPTTNVSVSPGVVVITPDTKPPAPPADPAADAPPPAPFNITSTDVTPEGTTNV